MEDVWKKLGPAVRDGVLRFLSVSQIESFDPEVYGGCNRRWWFRRVKRSKEDQSKPSELGEKVHTQIEHYLRHGDKKVLGDIAREGLRFFPHPGPDLKLEWLFGLPDGDVINSPLVLAGVPLIGKVDCAHARGEYIDNDGYLINAPDTCEVNDWKTTARIHDQKDREGVVIREGLAKSPSELADMHQMRAYAALAHMEWPDKARIVLAHGYLGTGWPRDAEKRIKIVDAFSAQERFLEDEALVEKMKHTASTKRVIDVEPNYDACGAYRGCSYKDECPRSPTGVLSSLFNIRRAPQGQEGEKPMGLIERRKLAAAGGAPTSSVEAPKDPVVSEEIAKLEAEEAAALSDNPVAPPDEPAPQNIAQAEVSQVIAGGEPGGPCAKGGQQVKVEDGSKSYTCECGAVLRVRPKALADGSYAMVPNHTVGEQTAKPEKKARAAKSDTVDKTPPVDESIGHEPETKTGTIRVALYLNASPDHRYPVQRLEDLAAGLAAELAIAVGAADIRCAPEKSPLAFGKWRGALAAAVVENRPKVGMWAVSSTSELGMVAFEALLPYADMVVRPLG